MRKKLIGPILTLFALLALCAVRVSAQELVRLCPGDFCTLAELLGPRQGLKAAAVTLLPQGTVLWYDGPLEPYRPVTAEALNHVYLFTAGGGDMGVTVCAGGQAGHPLRIRSINPVFYEAEREK